MNRSWLTKKVGLSVAVALVLAITLLVGNRSVHAETNPLSLASVGYQTAYAYVKTGETLSVVFNKGGAATNPTARITVTGPGNIVHPPNVTGTVNGDNSCQFNAAGSVCSWNNLSAVTSGLWEIKYNTTAPEQALGTPSGSHTWNITVRDGAAAAINGRVYNPMITMSQGGANNIPLWYQSPAGYTYRVDHLSFAGVISGLNGDNVGVRQNNTCTSGYRNAGSWNVGTYSTPALYECGDPFKLFTNTPDTTMPAQAPLPDGTMEWLLPIPTPPVISNVTFVGNSVTKRSGTISYDINQHTGQYVVEVDTNGDGIFGGPLDRSFPQFIDGGGTQTVPFDGNYANGNPIPPTQNINVRVAILKGGELHFSSADVETRGVGIQIQVLNGNTPNAYLNAYWNDSFDPNAATSCANSGGGNFSLNGKYSQGGVHSWGNTVTDCFGQWGNNKTVDDWTYVPLNSIQTLAVPGLTQSVHYRKTISPAVSVIAPDQEFTYTITAQNTGDLPLTGLSFTDDLSDVVDDATFDTGTGVTASSGTASYNGSNQVSWSGDLGAGDTATISYKVTMNDPVTGDGDLRNFVTGTGPNSNCVAGVTPIDPDCMTITPLPSISSEKSLVGPTNPKAGDVVDYEFTITNSGAAVTGLSVADDLTGVLDDATYNDDASAPIGAVRFDPATRRIIWNGDLATSGNAGDSVTVTLSVTVNRADQMGDAMLNNALVTSDCPNPAIFDSNDLNYEAACVTSTAVEAWMARKMASSTNVGPGGLVAYTVNIENTGAVNLTNLTVEDDLTNVLDDAVYGNNAQATSGTVAFTSPTLSWTGNLTAGQTAQFTYSVIAKQAGFSNQSLVNAITGPMNCPASAVTDPSNPAYNADCVTTTQVTVPSGSLAETGMSIFQSVIYAGMLFAGGMSGLYVVFRSRKKTWER